MTNHEWGTRSFLIEMKPNSEMVAILVDCPPSAAQNEAGEPIDEAVKVGTDRIEVLAGGSGDSDENSPGQPKYRADFSGLQLNPKIHCTASWADDNRVFMCKVRGEIDGKLLEAKSFATLADDLLASKTLEDYVKNLQEEKISDFHVHCALCGSCLFEREERPTLVALPKDDWLETSQSMDYFCHGTCGHNHGASGTTSEDAETLLGMADNKKAIKQWLPRENKVVLSDSHVMLKENETLKNRTVREAHLLRCAVCLTEVGNILRTKADVYVMHGSACSPRKDGPQDGSASFVADRFGSLNRFLTWTLLHNSQMQSSTKLLIRTLERKNYLLVWLLEPYMSVTCGRLTECNSEKTDRRLPCGSVRVIKTLYKTLKETTALEADRSSYAIVNLPEETSAKLAEILLVSTKTLPPTLRTVGNFFVGFLPLDG